MDFGFTNNENTYKEICAFRTAAIADGWSHQPTYQSEPEERASRHVKNGFTMQVLARARENEVLNPAVGMIHSMHGKWRFEAQISIWGPDGLAISLLGPIYDWEQIKAGMRRCSACGKQDIETQRYSFAGRCCSDCRPNLAAKYEKPGWDN